MSSLFVRDAFIIFPWRAWWQDFQEEETQERVIEQAATAQTAADVSLTTYRQ